VTFKYDPLGRRAQKNSSSGTYNYLYDGENRTEDVDSAGSLPARYTQGTGIDEPLAEFLSAAALFYEQDGLGSVTSTSNLAAALVNTYTYDSFGVPRASTGVNTNPFQYTGRDFDSETGLRYYRARYYDPAIGRFTLLEGSLVKTQPRLWAEVTSIHTLQTVRPI
jgi:RHS repeat-associated protein